MAKKSTHTKTVKKSETPELEKDFPDVESEDMDDEEEDAPDDDELVEQAKQARDAPGKDAPASEQPSPEQGAGESENPPTDSPTTTVTIEGEGSVPVFVDGAMQRLERGKPVKVSKAQLAALKDAGEKIKGK